MVRRASVVALLICVVPACSKDTEKSAATSESVSEEAPKALLGVRPEDWKCESVAPDAELATVLGGTPARLDPPFKPEPGVAASCNYSITTAPVDADAGAMVDSWSFDVDCRPGHEKRADMLFNDAVMRAEQNVSAYAAQVKSGKPPTDDAGVPLRAPQGSKEVQVGKRALDHAGAGLLFIDDDSPCYVRVSGPDAERRLALAQLVARNLAEANAPMTPHTKPVMKGAAGNGAPAGGASQP